AGQIADCRGTGRDVGKFLFGAGAKCRFLQEARARAGDFLYPGRRRNPAGRDLGQRRYRHRGWRIQYIRSLCQRRADPRDRGNAHRRERSHLVRESRLANQGQEGPRRQECRLLHGRIIHLCRRAGFSESVRCHLQARCPASTLTQVMSGQIDVGWTSPPFAVDLLREGKIRQIMRASDVPELRNQTARFMTANALAIESRRAVFVRYLQAYREVVDWMYADKAAVNAFADWAHIPETIARLAPEDYYPKNNVLPDRIEGL